MRFASTTAHRTYPSVAMIVLVAGLLTTPASASWIIKFKGTTTQVYRACAGLANGEVIEHGNGDVSCFNKDNGIGVTCGPEGTCHGSGSGPSPRRPGPMTTIHDIFGAQAGAGIGRPSTAAPPSLSSPSASPAPLQGDNCQINPECGTGPAPADLE